MVGSRPPSPMGVSLNAGCCAASFYCCSKVPFSPSLPHCFSLDHRYPTAETTPHPRATLRAPRSATVGWPQGHRRAQDPASASPAAGSAAGAGGGRGWGRSAMVWRNHGQVGTGGRVIKNAAPRRPRSSCAGGSRSGKSDRTFSCWWCAPGTGTGTGIFLITEG